MSTREREDKLKLLEEFIKEANDNLELKRREQEMIGEDIFNDCFTPVDIDRQADDTKSFVKKLDSYLGTLNGERNRLFNEREKMFDDQKLRISNMDKGDYLNDIGMFVLSDSLQEPSDLRILKEYLDEIDERIPPLYGISSLLEAMRFCITPLAEKEKEGNKSKSKQKEIKDLIELGRKKGYLTVSSINDLLTNNQYSNDQIEQITKLITTDLKIKVVESAKDIELYSSKKEQPRKHLRSKTTRRNS